MLNVFLLIIWFQTKLYKQVKSGKLLAVSRTLHLKEFHSSFFLNVSVFTGIWFFLSESKSAAVKMV